MDLSNKLFTSPFLKMYEFNMEMLDYRINKVLSMDVTGPLDKEKQAEYLMAFDSMLILFRSLFLEKKKIIIHAKIFTGRLDIQRLHKK